MLLRQLLATMKTYYYYITYKYWCHTCYIHIRCRRHGAALLKEDICQDYASTTYALIRYMSYYYAYIHTRYDALRVTTAIAAAAATLLRPCCHYISCCCCQGGAAAAGYMPLRLQRQRDIIAIRLLPCHAAAGCHAIQLPPHYCCHYAIEHMLLLRENDNTVLLQKDPKRL